MGPLSIAAIGWVMGSLVSKAVTQLLEAWANRMGLDKEFKTLKDQLLQLDALLRSAHSSHTNNSFLEDLVHNLQQLAYKAESLLDELDYYRLEDQIQQRGTSLVASSSSGHLLASHPISSTLESLYVLSAPYMPVPLPETFPSQINLSRRMKELAEELQKSEEKVRYALQTELLVNISRKTEATNPNQTSPFHTETKVVGRNKERDKLLNLLTNEESAMPGKVLILAIVGCGGLGKTTLAGLVYNDPNVKKCFDIRSWICVSTHFDIVRLTREMLEGACDNRYDGLNNLEVLHKKLKEELESKKFLLVLDDMWEGEDKSQWDKMKALLSNCMVKRVVILVTTRNPFVAKMVDARDTIYLKGLGKDIFLSFFSTCIFSDSNYGGNSKLRNIGQQIANKLKGNPLAAKTVSALLKKNLDERYWLKIRNSEEWKSQNGPNDIMPALRLSYEHMPFHLQRCFSYCAILPEDYPFTCEKLVHIWMAQGYLDVRSKGKRMEDIGSAYFNELLKYGFFQTIQSRNDNEVHYTFHDLIHDLACVVSFKECFSISDIETKEIPQTIRHLSILINTEDTEREEIVTALKRLDGENLGTIFSWDEWHFCISRSILDLLKKTKFLRAVRLDLSGLVQLRSNLHNFVSLRYLILIMSDFHGTLPREICMLYHLEVLELKHSIFLDELPNNFSDLVSLRHFIVEGKLHSKILGVGKLTSLQALNNFNVQQERGFEIEQLGSLKEIGGTLKIRNLENVKFEREANKAGLAKKEKLDALYLKWNDGKQENQSVLEGLRPNTNLKSLKIRGYGGVASPTWLDTSLMFLESLILVDCEAWELLPPIGDFESLKHLELSGMAVREIGCYGTRQSMKFQSLEELEIIDMPYLEKWVWSDQLQQFQCLKKLITLRIRNCKAWELLPPIGELEFLKHLELSGMAVREIIPECYGTRQSMKFQSLEELVIEEMPDLKKWVWSDRLQLSLCFKKLKKLTIQGCPKLVDLPLSGSATSEVLERFPSLESLKIEDCPLIFQLPPLPYSSLLSFISIKRTGIVRSMLYEKKRQDLSLIMDQNSSLKVDEVLDVHELKLSSLRFLEMSNISRLESLDFHSFLALEKLVITECESLTSLTFGDQLVCLRALNIISCKTLSSMKGLKSWINLRLLEFRECPGFIAAWDFASKEIERTEPDFSLSLKTIVGDTLALLTLPICKQLNSLQYFCLEVSAFTEDHEVSLQLLTSIDLVDIRGCKKNLQSFPFDLFPSLNILLIEFPHIRSIPTNNRTEITEECLKLRNIEEVHIFSDPVQIRFKLSSEEMICQQTDAVN